MAQTEHSLSISDAIETKRFLNRFVNKAKSLQSSLSRNNVPRAFRQDFRTSFAFNVVKHMTHIILKINPVFIMIHNLRINIFLSKYAFNYYGLDNNPLDNLGLKIVSMKIY